MSQKFLFCRKDAKTRIQILLLCVLVASLKAFRDYSV